MAYKTRKSSRRRTSRRTSKKAVGWYAFAYRIGSKRVVKGRLKPVRTKVRALAVARRMSKRLGKKVSLVKVAAVRANRRTSRRR